MVPKIDKKKRLDSRKNCPLLPFVSLMSGRNNRESIAFILSDFYRWILAEKSYINPKYLDFLHPSASSSISEPHTLFSPLP